MIPATLSFFLYVSPSVGRIQDYEAKARLGPCRVNHCASCRCHQPLKCLLQAVHLSTDLCGTTTQSSPQTAFGIAILLEPPPDDLERFVNETANNGLIRYFGVFHGESLLITKSQGIKGMMLLQAYNYDKLPLITKLIGQVTGQSLLVAAQDEHKRQRKSLLPAFKYKYTKDLFPRFWFDTTELVAALEKEIDRVGEGSAAVSFGVEVNAIAKPDSDLARLLPLSNCTSPKATTYRLLAFLSPYWLYARLPLARRYELDQIVNAQNDATGPLIRSRRKALAGKQILDPDADEDKFQFESQTATEIDVVSTLPSFKEPLTDKKLMAQSATTLAAGQDTTSVAITWALYLLAHHPHVQSTLRSEVHKHLPSPDMQDETVDAPLIGSLPYSPQYGVCNETLRFFPLAPVLRRYVVKSGTIVLGEPIPVGTVVMTSIWGTHRMKSVWGPDAGEFKPERFIQYDRDGKMKSDPHAGFKGQEASYRYLPFGAGPRSCIGERYARGEFAALVSGLIGRFEWSVLDPAKKMLEDIKMNFGIVSKPEGGLQLRARRVDGW
ncbi:cytochrome P450 [Cladophialophora carrionii]|uniref:Cytochrome P450 n=1 Tax=Cladophialophora carrionii TaxID=86049 RepID=A0A1C1CUD5_9EURO|nr:cytochrome P450 [Cladophialophora carrionii]